MLALDFSRVVGFFRRSEQVAEAVHDAELHSKSQLGYEFEHDELIRIMKRFKGYSSVTFTDARGQELTPKDIATRFGPDGGIDAFIEIEARTGGAAKRIETMVMTIIINTDY